MSKTLVCVGLATIGRMVLVDSMPARGSKGRAGGYREAVGSEAVSAAIAAVRMGCNVTLLSLVGDDKAGTDTVARLRAAGMDVDGITVVAGAMSASEVVLVDRRGARAIAVHVDDELLSRAPLPSIRGLEAAGAVLADTSWGAGARYVLDAARHLRIPTIVAVDAADVTDIVRVGRRADHAVFSRAGLEAFAGSGDGDASLRVARERLGCGVCVAFDGAGTWVLGSDGSVCVPVSDGAPADAADGRDGVFFAAFGVAIADGGSAEEAARFASRVAVESNQSES